MNNKIGFMVQEEVFEDDENKIITTLEKMGIPYALHPFEDFDCHIPKTLDTDIIFCYGSLEWIGQIQRHCDKRLKTFCTLDNFDCKNYYSMIPRKLLFNNDYEFFYTNIFISSLNKSVFIRPCSGSKPKGMSGGIYSQEDIPFLQEKLEPYDLVVRASVKHIDYEYRVIISDNKVVTGCQYKSFCRETNKLGFDPLPIFPNGVKIRCQEIIDKINWSPDDIYVLDVVDSQGVIYVMEINALSTAGWYDCDTEVIINAIIRNLTKAEYPNKCFVCKQNVKVIEEYPDSLPNIAGGHVEIRCGYGSKFDRLGDSPLYRDILRQAVVCDDCIEDNENLMRKVQAIKHTKWRVLNNED